MRPSWVEVDLDAIRRQRSRPGRRRCPRPAVRGGQSRRLRPWRRPGGRSGARRRRRPGSRSLWSRRGSAFGRPESTRPILLALRTAAVGCHRGGPLEPHPDGLSPGASSKLFAAAGADRVQVKVDTGMHRVGVAPCGPARAGRLMSVCRDDGRGHLDPLRCFRGGRRLHRQPRSRRSTRRSPVSDVPIDAPRQHCWRHSPSRGSPRHGPRRASASTGFIPGQPPGPRSRCDRRCGSSPGWDMSSASPQVTDRPMVDGGRSPKTQTLPRFRSAMPTAFRGACPRRGRFSSGAVAIPWQAP